ncbi:hypothetical protein AB0L13_40770 [Saccharopolyspora shandongensis]|uniref:hypothetical protein n=1 Tax=Saccharopolyspora shandongensis TaxID=418495 RepID=UPI003448A9C9
MRLAARYILPRTRTEPDQVRAITGPAQQAAPGIPAVTKRTPGGARGCDLRLTQVEPVG